MLKRKTVNNNDKFRNNNYNTFTNNLDNKNLENK